LNINSIDSPIERGQTKGNPNAHIHYGVELSAKQRRLLAKLPDFDSRAVLPRKAVNMSDLAALTASTGDEFALFTKGKERLVIRGNSYAVNMTVEEAKSLFAEGFRWSGHTHPGTTAMVLFPSDGDTKILECFSQAETSIYNSKGQFRRFR
jgi:hypothetical protein